MSQIDFDKDRECLIQYVRQELIGPANGPYDPLYEDSPAERYLMGVLFPRDADNSVVLDDEDEAKTATDHEEVDDSPISSLFQRLPASMGVSFYVIGSKVRVEIVGSEYQKPSKTDLAAIESMPEEERPYGPNAQEKWPKWVRSEIFGREKPQEFLIDLSMQNSTQLDVLDGKGKLHVLTRRMGGGFLVTVSLVNSAVHEKEGGKINPADCIFQAGLRCKAVGGVIGEYPSIQSLSYDDEEEELALQYSDHVAYAIGHGCSASWKEAPMGAEFVETEFMPVSEVKPVTTSVDGDSKVLSIQYLSDGSVSTIDLAKNLNHFVDDYAAWVSKIESAEFDQRYPSARIRIINRIKDALSRMRAGVDVIASNPKVRQAFNLANLSMLMQMIHSEISAEKHPRNASPMKHVNYSSKQYSEKSWRPFQLAFQLLVLPSLVDSDREDRDFVDLLWFPTGGGKTEAYLSIASFEMLYRRIALGEEGLGTAVLKRYTLRLLTAQQFQRASTLICALEIIRRDRSDLLGDMPFRLGLWVGQASTPNHYTNNSNEGKGALELYKDVMNQARPENPFQLQKCPWCGTEIIPKKISDDIKDYGVSATESTFKFYCPSDECEFHDEIPVTVVDEDIYANPPTFVIGTIDKFARLAWDARSASIFGAPAPHRKPPSLVIQDEMHLISGPLGTIAGIYEAAIDTLIESKGLKPKIIAATATIRRSGDQVQKLYAGKVTVFPPPGLRASDSYFSRENREERGRFYIGLMGQGHSPVTSVVRASAALSQSVYEANLSDEAIDSWWTQVIYHNSRRELGKTMTLASDDIPARVEVIASDHNRVRLNPVNVEELSSNVRGADIPRILEDLEASSETGDAVDLLPCTNMISVGVDVSRLGLMLIIGQPKSTSEYIQASSRVGRSKSRPSGLVFTLYSPSKPRDRSHYESFVHYHSALYRYVEPTSVTPYAEPARRRALHAAVIIVARHACGLGENEDAGLFDRNNPVIQKNMKKLIERMVAADPTEKAGIERGVEQVFQEWEEAIADANNSRRPLRYQAREGRQFRGLMTSFDATNAEGWKTLNSMRNVDSEVAIHVFGASYD